MHAAPQVGRRAHLLVAFPEPQDEQGLREVVCHWGGVHLCGDESIDGEALSSLMRLFGQFQRGSSRKLGCHFIRFSETHGVGGIKGRPRLLDPSLSPIPSLHRTGATSGTDDKPSRPQTNSLHTPQTCSRPIARSHVIPLPPQTLASPVGTCSSSRTGGVPTTRWPKGIICWSKVEA